MGQKDGGCSERPAERYQCCAADEGSTAAMISLADMSLADADVPFWQQAARLADAEHPARRPKPKTVKQHKRQMERYILAAEAGDTDAMGRLPWRIILAIPKGATTPGLFCGHPARRRLRYVPGGIFL